MIVAATEDLLGVLKYGLLALLYLFFVRVLFAVWSELRNSEAHQRGTQSHTHPAAGTLSPAAPTTPAPRPVGDHTANLLGGRAARGPKPRPPKDDKPSAKRGKDGHVARLAIVEPKILRGASYAVGNEMTIGRNDTCMIAIPDDTFASGLHARIYRQGDTAWVDDLGSTNGTFVNGRRVEGATELAAGDSLQVGNTIFEAG